MKNIEPKIEAIGLSKDRRTNVWRVTLSCGHRFNPPTTMFSSQHVECPKCPHNAWVNYNTGEITEYEYK